MRLIMLTISLFGQISLHLNGQLLPFATRPKTTPLLAYLLLHQAEPIPRETLAFTLWPDEPERKARANLRRHLHYLRQALPDSTDWFESDHRSVAWISAEITHLDVAEFERQIAYEQTLASGIALYTGDLLEHEPDDFLFYERQRLRDLYLNALSRLVQLQRQRGEWQPAIQTAQTLLRADPYREDALRQLMALQAQSGNRSGAIASYDQFAALLEADLGIAPMPDTQAFYAQIVANDGAVSQPDPPDREPIALLGRDGEVAQLQSWWNHVQQRQGKLVLLGGEAGIGKSTLVNHLAQRVQAQGGLALVGYTTTAEPMPNEALKDALNTILPDLAALPLSTHWKTALLPLLPDLAALLPAPPARVPLSPADERARLFEAVRQALAALATTKPLLLVLEDLHWASDSTIELVDSLARQLSHDPILLLVTYREEETSRTHPLRRLRRQLQREKLAQHLTVSRLAPESVAELVGHQLNDRSLSAEQLAALYRSSQGNPLFVQELLHVWQSEPERPIDQQLPDTIQSLLQTRLARLSAEERQLADVAAVAGIAFDVELLREVSGWDEGRILEALTGLQDRYLIRESGRGQGFDFAFTHQLVQASLYADLNATTRQRRHRRMGHVMVDLYADRLDALAGMLAHHFGEGGARAQAADFSLLAARRALAQFADQEALAFLGRVLSFSDDANQQFESLLLRQSIAQRQGNRQAQAADLVSAERLAATPDQRLTVLRHHIQLAHDLGERDREDALLTQFEQDAAASGKAIWQAVASHGRADYLRTLGRYDEAQALFEQASDTYRTADRMDEVVACLCAQASMATDQSDFGRVRALLAEAMALAKRHTASPALLVSALQTAANAAFVQQDYDTSDALCHEGLTICEEIGFPAAEAAFHKQLGANDSRRFRVRSARRHYQTAERLFHRVGSRQGEAAVVMNQGILAMRLGHYAQGAEAFRQAERLFASLRDLRGQAIGAINLAAAAIYHGDFDDALAASERGVVLARQLQSVHLEADALGNWGEAERGLGRDGDAQRHFEQAVALRRTLDGQRVNLATDLFYLTRIQLLQGNVDGARVSAEELQQLFDQHEADLIAPHTLLWILAEVKAAAGDPDATIFYERAWRTLAEQADAIPDDESREAFLAREPHPAILAAVAPR